ncbi:MAG: hypothetical protein E6J10_03400 [Chloroflexi bacterium]|nr:MAG: hypothetical protein E6J10_03400 [Chloroflexota bacterium]
MNAIIRRIMREHWRPGSAALAGLLATAAYSLVMEGDMYLTGNRYSDVRFIQGLIDGKSQRPGRFPFLAWIIHFLNGVILAELYAAVFKRFLPGPNWLKGSIFGEMFLLSTWWMAPFVDKYHPLTKRGELARLATWTSFFQNIVRHLVFGLLLGLLYGD